MSKLPVSIVCQISDYHCFPACLVSYYNDLSLPLTQKEVVDRCPIAHAKGTKIEGALNLQRLSDVETEFTLSIAPILASLSFQHPQEAIFLFTFWKGKSSDFHCVRFAGQENGRVFVMNPKNHSEIEEYDEVAFSRWIKLITRVKKI